jgi:hypothetical protein
MEIYVSQKSYTSHVGLSQEEEKNLSNQVCNPLPRIINGVEIFNTHQEYIPVISAHEYPKKEWIYRRSGWCEHIRTGLKVRLLESATPDYYKENGCGSATRTLQVKRGKNA